MSKVKPASEKLQRRTVRPGSSTTASGMVARVVRPASFLRSCVFRMLRISRCFGFSIHDRERGEFIDLCRYPLKKVGSGRKYSIAPVPFEYCRRITYYDVLHVFYPGVKLLWHTCYEISLSLSVCCSRQRQRTRKPAPGLR
jgi:hypothetical protein